jgi:alpha,alpha-trehalase
MAQQHLYALQPLFADVQLAGIFPDSKTFVDCTPKLDAALILEKYLQQKNTEGFSLNAFVSEHFEMPHVFGGNYHTKPGATTTQHIKALWDVLTRKPDDAGAGSLIPLPHPYIVPGGRFGEVYYWDSYFTMLGLKEAGRYDMIENMVANFSHLIQTLGFIPNGNRYYYLGRSQPPFFAQMVQLLASFKGHEVLTYYLPSLLAEYDFWMKGSNTLTTSFNSSLHTVLMPDGAILNRYYDIFDTPRPEAYKEDVEIAVQAPQEAADIYRHLRAGAESGWDYSSRWFKDGQNFSTIHTTTIVPVDLNCLLYYHEQTIAKAYGILNDAVMQQQYLALAEKRKLAIQDFCWSNNSGFYFDYDIEANRQKHEYTLAALYPLYCKIASQQQADLVAEHIQSKFLKAGGVITTLKNSGQQWDAPNGWAPLQWITITGLENYGHHSIAKNIARRWLALNDKVFAATGKMMEKYNVEDTDQLAGGGEYPGQDGFGWTNGVYLALQKLYVL